jgi:hypothetical protein
MRTQGGYLILLSISLKLSNLHLSSPFLPNTTMRIIVKSGILHLLLPVASKCWATAKSFNSSFNRCYCIIAKSTIKFINFVFISTRNNMNRSLKGRPSHPSHKTTQKKRRGKRFVHPIKKLTFPKNEKLPKSTVTAFVFSTMAAPPQRVDVRAVISQIIKAAKQKEHEGHGTGKRCGVCHLLRAEKPAEVPRSAWPPHECLQKYLTHTWSECPTQHKEGEFLLVIIKI